MDHRSALLYAQLKGFKHLINKTAGFIRWSLAKVNSPYVACSFGKDSAVLLDLALSVRPDIPVRFVRWQGETELIDNYDQVISAWNLPKLTQVIMSRDSLSDTRKDRYHTDEFDSYLIGLRKEESVARRITLSTHGMFYPAKSGLIRISPLADWKTQDIAAYCISRQLPMLNSYASHGIASRTASRIPRESHGIRASFIADLKRRDLNAYHSLLSKFPELHEYT